MREVYQSLLSLLETEGIQRAPLTELALTPMWAVVCGEADQCGAAFRFGRDHSVYGPQPGEAEFLSTLSDLPGQPLTKLIECLLDADDLYSRAFCIAAMNALSAPLNTPDQLGRRGWDTKASSHLPFLRPEDKVVCIGYGCLIDQVLEVCPQVHVSDMRPASQLKNHLLGTGRVVESGPEQVIFHRAEENDVLLSDADVVFVTGCTLVNGTWRSLLHAASNARIRGVFGPSAGLPPELLKAMGFNYVTSSAFLDPVQLSRNLRRPLTDPFAGNCTWRYSFLL